MAHSFVVNRLASLESARWTSHYGIQKAADLVTRPFLALRVPLKDLGFYEGYHGAMFRNYALLIVSSQKPTGMDKDHYLTVVLTERKGKRDLLVQPPLTRDGKLYIHTYPKMYERTPIDGLGVTTSDPPTVSPHRLDEASLRAVCSAVMEDHNQRKRLKRLEAILSSSPRDVDAVKSDWDTWSGKETEMEYLHEPSGLILEHLPFSIPPLKDLCSTSQELLVYKQLTADYSWPGVTPAISWVMNLRDVSLSFLGRGARFVNNPFIKRLVKQGHPPPPAIDRYITNTGSLSELIASLPATTDKLHSMKIPRDAEPLPVEASEEEDEEFTWDDDPSPHFEMISNVTRAVTASDIKIVAFDLFGTIFDREMAILEAVQIFTQSIASTHSPRQLVQLYIECEALQNHKLPDAAYVDTARSALKEFGIRLGLCPSDAAISDGVKCLLRPHLYPDAISTVTALRDRGYTILGLSSLDNHTFSQYFQQYMPRDIFVPFPSLTCTPLYKQDRSLFSRILEYSNSIYKEIHLSQILIVTSAPFRMAEPANLKGFPTALVQRDGDLESNVEHHSAGPTVTITELSKLCVALEGLLSAPVRGSPYSASDFRVYGLYQGTKRIGHGSYGEPVSFRLECPFILMRDVLGNVFAGFHVLTGEKVAMKVEMPTGRENELSVLPYEAQIYRQLGLNQGFPSLKWIGMEGGAHVAIFERLGATLQELRRVCRGRLSLKTVLMLAEQMLTRIEFVHSRGIIVRDIKPENFAMGFGERSSIVYLFDFGLAKLFVDPVAKAHIPFRQGLDGLGTPRYASYNVHFGREQGRRDDIEALGNVLLFLLHGRLPWQGAFAPTLNAKLDLMGEIKAGPEFQEYLARSPLEFGQYFENCRALLFEEQPNYTYLKEIFRKRMAQEGWEYDGIFDWTVKTERGSLLPEEYRFDRELVEVDFHR